EGDAGRVGAPSGGRPSSVQLALTRFRSAVRAPSGAMIRPVGGCTFGKTGLPRHVHPDRPTSRGASAMVLLVVRTQHEGTPSMSLEIALSALSVVQGAQGGDGWQADEVTYPADLDFTRAPNLTTYEIPFAYFE